MDPVTEKLANTGCQGAPASIATSIILLKSSFVLDLAASAVVDWAPCRVPVNRGREWKLSELASAVQPLPEGRAFMVGKQLFKVANCVACHKLNNEGRVFGPDLAKLGSVDKKKHTPQYILESILNPSKDIDKKFQSQVFALDSGKVVTGMVVKETPNTVEIVIDPLAKGRPTVIKKSSIDDRAASKTSIMPLGLLNKLSREEILDLIAYVYARGDKSNPLFMHEHAEKK